MNKTVIFYYSKYGTTKQYAQWLSDVLNADLFDIKDAKKKNLQDYNTIILGGALYAGSIKGLNLFINNFDNINNKKLVIFTCGLADYIKEINQENIYKRISGVIPKNILECIKVFYLRGGINYKGLSFLHKIMMAMMKKMIEKKGKNNLDEEGKAFLETYGKEINFTDKITIQPIIEYLSSVKEETK